MNRWYFTPDNRQRFGPVTSKQLRQLALSGTIRPEHLVMSEGSGKWIPAAKLKGLFPGSAALGSPLPAPAKPSGRRDLLLACGLFSGILLLFVGGLGLVIAVKSGGWLKDRGAPDSASVARREDTGKPADGPRSAQPEKPAVFV